MNFTTDVIVPLGIVAIFLWWWFYSNKQSKYYKNIPVPPTVPIFGNALDFKTTAMLLKSFSKYTKDYGDVVKINLGPFKEMLVVANYKMVEFLLSSTTILKKSEDYQFFEPWLGSGLLIGSGPKWKLHRKMLTPAFHFQILENFVETFDSCGNNLIQKLTQEIDKGGINIFQFVTLCTLDVICETTMGTKINAQDDSTSKYVQSVKEMCRILIERTLSPIGNNSFLFRFTRNYCIQNEVIGVLHEKSNSVIGKRSLELKAEPKEILDDDTLTSGKKKKAFLDLLLEARVDGQTLTHQDIREEVDTFMFAGHDTTATAISFTLFCLSNNPHIQQKVYEEQQTIFEETDDHVVTYSHLQSMKYLELVIKESLRLYPPVPIIGRQAEKDFEYENTCFPKENAMVIYIFGIHRSPKYFEDPETFNPDRFKTLENKFPYAYIPFSAGPRNCIGQKFAMLEMKSIISKLIRKFELRPTNPPHELQLVSETVLQSSNGIKINLKLRS